LYYVETLENDFRDIADTRPELFARHAAEAGQIDHIVSRSAGCRVSRRVPPMASSSRSALVRMNGHFRDLD